MKRLDLVQLTIIIVGIFSAFYIVGLLPQFLFYFFSWFSQGLSGGYILNAFIENILLISMYLIFAIYAIKNSKHLAEWICNKANLHADINFAINTRELLFTVFVGLGVYGLVKELAAFLMMSFRYIRARNSFVEDTVSSPDMDFDLTVRFISICLFFTLVYYAKVFADFLAGKINNVEPADVIEEKTT